MIASFARWNLALVILAMLTALAVPARAGDDRAAYYLAMMHKDGAAAPSTLRDSNLRGQRTARRSNRRSAYYGKSPAKRSVLVRIFYFPADATINGAEYFADLLGLDRLAWDLRILSGKHNNFFIGLFALFWWFLIVKAVFQVCGFWFGSHQATGRGASDRGKRRPTRQS